MGEALRSIPNPDNEIEKEDEEMFSMVFYMADRWREVSEIPKEAYVEILKNVLELTERFVLHHRFKNSDAEEFTYMIGEQDIKLDNLLVKMFLNAEKFGDKEIIKLIDTSYARIQSVGLDSYQAAIKNRVASGGLRN